MSVCMCVCMCVYVCVYMCMCACMCLYMYVCVCVCMYVCIVFMYVCIYGFMYVCMCVCMCPCIYVCECMYVCVCLSTLNLSICLSKVCSTTRITLRHGSPSPAGSRTTVSRLSSPQPSHCTDPAVSPSGTFVSVRLRLCQYEFQRKCQARIRSVCHLHAVRCQQPHINRGVIEETEPWLWVVTKSVRRITMHPTSLVSIVTAATVRRLCSVRQYRSYWVSSYVSIIHGRKTKCVWY